MTYSPQHGNNSNDNDNDNNLFLQGSTRAILSALPTLSVQAPECPKNANANAAALPKHNQRVVIIGGSIGGMATAACLRAAGFSSVTVLERAAEQARPGAGIGLDDASVAIAKGLGLQLGSHTELLVDDNEHKVDVTVQKMRYTEERMVGTTDDDSLLLLRQPYPYSAVLYAELAKGLEKAATTADGSAAAAKINRGCKATKVEQTENGTNRVYYTTTTTATAAKEEESSTPYLECDLVVAADGPRSRFRQQHFYENAGISEGKQLDDLRFAGYAAWRGTIPEQDLPPKVVENLRTEYPLFSNCLYFIWGPPGKSAVLYDIGNGIVNWLMYETCHQPKAPPGRTTTTATREDIAKLKETAKEDWGSGLGGVMEATPEPFQNDIYDIQTPLTSLVSPSNPHFCILGDAAHPVTPHCAKGSNMAIHDAYVLARCAEHASTVEEMLQEYSKHRVQDTRTTVLLSRHLGRLRKGMPLMAPDGQTLLAAEQTERPTDAEHFTAQVRQGGLATATLPIGGGVVGSNFFEPVWKFVQDHIPVEQRGFCLDRTPPPLHLTTVNHISRETEQVDALVQFYTNVLGLRKLRRPEFGFGGAWLELPGGHGQQLHIIERDPEKPRQGSDYVFSTDISPLPEERFIRRSHHLALTVPDIEQAKQALKEHDVPFAINKVPKSSIEQLFVYDPDGNGIEIGNFDIHKK